MVPQTRIKRIMRMDEDVGRISQRIPVMIGNFLLMVTRGILNITQTLT